MNAEPPPPPATPQAPEPDWMQRNWKWAVPLGCGSIMLVAAGLLAGFVALVFGVIRQSDVYSQALDRAQNHPAAIEALGTPIETGWMLSGNISIVNDTGNADLTIPLAGPKSTGTLYAVATLQSGTWTFSQLDLRLEDGTQLDLLTGTGEPPDDPDLVTV